MTLRERIFKRFMKLPDQDGNHLATPTNMVKIAAEVERLMRVAYRLGILRGEESYRRWLESYGPSGYPDLPDDIEIEPGGSPTPPAHLLPNPPGCSHRECRYPECSCERPGCEEEKP